MTRGRHRGSGTRPGAWVVGALTLALLGAVMSAMTGHTATLLVNPSDLTVLRPTGLPSAATGCASPGSAVVLASADTYVDQAVPGASYGTQTALYSQSGAGSANRRTLVNFALPALPTGCTVTAATLSLFATASTAGRTLQALRVATSWTDAATWNSQPQTTGTAATTTSATGWRSWGVAAQVASMYTSGAFGFRVGDATESAGTTNSQTWVSGEGTSTRRPMLSIGWGGAGGCTSGQTVAVTATADASLLEVNPTRNEGGDKVLKVYSSAGANARSVVRFPLPTLAAGCSVLAARLELVVRTGATGRTLQAFRVPVTDVWTELAVTWATQPATSGVAATTASAASGTLTLDTTDQVRLMVAAGATGEFLLRDAFEGQTSSLEVSSRNEGGGGGLLKPLLVVTTG